MPACVNRIFGRVRNGADPRLSLPEALVAVSARAGAAAVDPARRRRPLLRDPWTSKGYRDGARRMANHTVDALWRWSDGGRAARGLRRQLVHARARRGGGAALLSEVNAERHSKLTVIDSIGWAHERLLPALEVKRKLGAVAVHPPCATRHLALDSGLAAIAGELADEVVIPPTATCCGFAGDRGMLHPELPLAATADEAAELAGERCDAHLCSNRTCEIGLQRGTGRTFESFVFALEELTR